jgi:Tfp pilus assembly protein PilX
MDDEQNHTFDIVKPFTGENGVVLIAALTLLTALLLLGTTAYILSSTDIKIGGNFRNNQLVLQVAMAGAERAREALRVENLASSNTASFSDELNSSTRKGANGALNGYSATTDDVALASGTMNGVSYAAYLSNDSTDGTTNTTDSNGKVLINSVATGPNNSKAQVQTVVKLYSPSIPATIYSKDNMTLNGSSIGISGNDACSGSTNLAPIYTKDPATTTTDGNPTLTGSPATAQHGTLDIDIQSYIDALKGEATPANTLTTDQTGTTYGNSTSYVTVYADAEGTQADHELRLNNVTGYGILLVKGDLQIAGNFNWNGVIIVTGIVSSSGGGSTSKNIQGQIMIGGSSLGDSAISGSVTIGYDSCNVKKAFSDHPLTVLNWKQSY